MVKKLLKILLIVILIVALIIGVLLYIDAQPSKEYKILTTSALVQKEFTHGIRTRYDATDKKPSSLLHLRLKPDHLSVQMTYVPKPGNTGEELFLEIIEYLRQEGWTEDIRFGEYDKDSRSYRAYKPYNSNMSMFVKVLLSHMDNNTIYIDLLSQSTSSFEIDSAPSTQPIIVTEGVL